MNATLPRSAQKENITRKMHLDIWRDRKKDPRRTGMPSLDFYMHNFFTRWRFLSACAFLPLLFYCQEMRLWSLPSHREMRAELNLNYSEQSCLLLVGENGRHRVLHISISAQLMFRFTHRARRGILFYEELWSCLALHLSCTDATYNRSFHKLQPVGKNYLSKHSGLFQAKNNKVL